MSASFRALSELDFRRLYIGATASSVGDGMSFVALIWLAVNRPHGTAELGILIVLYTAPVFIGGWFAGALLVRVDKRHVIAIDSVNPGMAVASVPVNQFFGLVADWRIFAVA